MSFEQLLLALKARYRIIVFTLGMTLGVALLVTLLMPRMYTASSAVVLDVKNADPIAGTVSPAWQQPSFMATQLDIIQSDRVASRVVKMLRLDEKPGVVEDWRENTGGKGDVVSWLGQSLKGNLDSKPARDSNVITLSWKGRDPKMAADVANAYAQAYIDTSVELRRDPASQYTKYFSAQAQAARDRLEKAQSALSAFQQNNQIIVVSDDRYDIETMRLSALSNSLLEAQSQKVDTASREAQARSSSASLQEVLMSPVIVGLKSDLARQDAKLQEMSASLGPNNPQLQRAQAEVASLRRKIASETGQITSGISTSNRVNSQRASEIGAALDAQKARVLKLKQDRDAASVLQRDVDAAKAAYEAVSLRVTQSSIESQASQTNISILNPAIEPSRPSSPKIPLSIALALVAGLILGIGAALLLEQLDRRVRSIDDLGRVLGLPVMGVIGRPPARIAPQRSLGFSRKPLPLPQPGAA